MVDQCPITLTLSPQSPSVVHVMLVHVTIGELTQSTLTLCLLSLYT